MCTWSICVKIILFISSNDAKVCGSKILIHWLITYKDNFCSLDHIDMRI